MSKKAVDFDTVLKEELGEISESRKKRTEICKALRHAASSDNGGDVYADAARMNLVGLAFSGGGIRSATFNLGILQGLARYGLLPRIDYLSTVSGGGYIGGWLTAHIKRATLEKVSKDLVHEGATVRTPEADEISFLRRYSNYLTPRRGLFSADTLAAVSTYVRNLFLNLLMLLSILSAALLLPRLARYVTNKAWPIRGMEGWSLLQWTGLAFLVFAVLVIVANIKSLKAWRTAASERATPWYTLQKSIQFLVVIPVLISAWCLAPVVLTWVGWVPFREINKWTIEDRTVWGLPLMMTLFTIFVVVCIGLAGRCKWMDSHQREWFSRLGAWNLTYTLVWLAFTAIALYSAQYWALTKSFTQSATFAEYLRSKELWLALIAALLGGGAGGVVAGSNDSHTSIDEEKKTSVWITLSPYAFVLGLTMALSILLDGILAKASYFGVLPETNEFLCLVAICLVLSALAFGFSFTVGVNDFSMHDFYRNRLVRCYIGAPNNTQRRPHAFTGFDPSEHYLRVSDLTTQPSLLNGRPKDVSWVTEPYIGPFCIINTALNLVRGDNLAWQQRKAASFVITPLHCGYNTLQKRKGKLAEKAFRPTADYDDGISVGTAMAISGAAASPNMGYHSSKPLAFIMTMLNVRLGRWLGNPRHDETWKKAGPNFALLSLLSELFGFTDEDSRFVYLSDGGHFENLGIYELVRRRCRYIIACDASQDGGVKFEDLGNAIEKCRTDLGIDIDIDLDPIRYPVNSKRSKRHCAVGTIHYQRMDRKAPHGILVYIKASLTGDEPTDVLRYSAQDANFPHQSTGDQFFDESQFESYRALGDHIAREILNGAGEERDVKDMSSHKLFNAIKHYWFPPSVHVEAHFTKHGARVDEIYNKLRTSEHLAFLSHQIYPEWRKLVKGYVKCEKTSFWLPESCEEIREGFYICNEVIQLMENVYLDLNLDQEFDHPDNRGWMNFFRHWSWSGMFRVTWAISAATYGARFQTFCRRRLDLKLGEVVIGPVTKEYPPKWDELEKTMVLNFLEIKLLKKLIKSDREPERLLASAASSFSIYPLALKVLVPGRPESIEFYFGFGLTYEVKKNGKTETVLRFFRVQDHLRRMGLGRQGLTNLMKSQVIADLNTDDYPREPVEGEAHIPFPTEDEVEVMRALFESVQAQSEQDEKQEKQQKQEQKQEQKKKQED